MSKKSFLQLSRIKKETIIILLLTTAFISLSTLIPYFKKVEYYYLKLIISWLAFLSFYFLAHLTTRREKPLKFYWIFSYWIIGSLFLKYSALSEFELQMNWYLFAPLGHLVGLSVIARKALRLESFTTKENDKNKVSTTTEGPDGLISSKNQILTDFIGHLNGKTITRVILTNHNHTLEIAGGSNNYYVVYYSDNPTNDDSWFIYTVDTNQHDSREIELVIGSILGYMPISVVTSKDKALEIAQEFQETGRITLTNNWANTGPMAGGLRPSD